MYSKAKTIWLAVASVVLIGVSVWYSLGTEIKALMNPYTTRSEESENKEQQDDVVSSIEKETPPKVIVKEEEKKQPVAVMPTEPESLNDTKIGIMLDGIMKKYGTVGGSLAVIKNGQIKYCYEYGYADRKAKKEVTRDTKYRIASLSKVFVTMNAAALADDGKLNLDGDIGDVLGLKVRNPRYKKDVITTRMLLTHTSSIYDGALSFNFSPLSSKLKSGIFLSAEPGTYWRYSNLAMGIAGAVVECASDTLLTDVANKYFLDEMGIDAAFDGARLDDKSLVGNCYEGSALSRTGEKVAQAQPKGGPGDYYHTGAGGLIISSVDLAKLVTILLNDGMYGDKQYLSKKMIDEIHTVQFSTEDFNQCLGIRKRDNMLNGRTMYYHPGSYYGIHSDILYDKETKTGYVMITSGASSRREDNDIFRVCQESFELCQNYLIDGNMR